MDLSKIYKKRDDWAHKGQFGTVLVVAGCRDICGSPVFNSISALRAGADLVMVVSPTRSADICARFLPDVLTSPLRGDFLSNEHVPTILALAEESDAVVLGGGLGRSHDIFEVIRKIISGVEKPMVVDAEGLRAIGQNHDILKGKKVILTPHANEMEALIGKKVENDLNERKKVCQELAKATGAAVLLKGHTDVVSNGHDIYLNQTGSPLMTKGGFGDTLAGICGALLSRGLDPYVAAGAGAYINGKAGELACKEFGEGVLASDIFWQIPKVIAAK
jgi:NAD(P)H-hydrate epimerase